MQSKNNTFLVSTYKNVLAKQKIEDVSIIEILESFKSETNRKLIEPLRLLDAEEYAIAKKTLPCFTASGTFENAHIAKGLQAHSGIIQIDIDSKGNEKLGLHELSNLQELKSKIIADKYTFACAISPSGKGLKAFVRIDVNAHNESFFALEKYFLSTYNCVIDKSCKDVCRLCFFTYDVDTFIDGNKIKFEVIKEIASTKKTTETNTRAKSDKMHHPKTVNECMQFTEQKKEYKIGDRDNCVFLFANNGNRHKIDKNEILNYALFHFSDLGEDLVRYKVQRAYENLAENGMYANNNLGTPTAPTVKKGVEKKENVFVENSKGEIYENVFVENNCMIYKKDKAKFRLSNFNIKINHHLQDETSPKRVVQMINEAKENIIFEIPAKGFARLEAFKEVVESKGNFIYYGSKGDFSDLKTYLYANEKKAIQLPYLGYVKEHDIYVFSNKIIDNKGVTYEVNEDGVINIGNDNLYYDTFSANTKTISNTQSEMNFKYKNSDVDIKAYYNQFIKVFDSRGVIGILYTISAFYRDIIFNKLNSFPHLFLIGSPQSGKSTFREGLLSIFGKEQTPLMLNAGSTSKAIFRRLNQFSNALITCDEYKNNIDAKLIDALKAAFDGEGYERATMSNDNKTHSTQTLSAVVVAGQELPTKENALFSRGLLLEFYNTEFSAEEKKEFDTLTDMQENGLSHFANLLMQHRELIKKEFSNEFTKVYNYFRGKFGENTKSERILKNYSAILTPYAILHRNNIFKLNVTNYFTYVEELITKHSSMINASSEVNAFWEVVSYLKGKSALHQNKDYHINRAEGKNIFGIHLANIFPVYERYMIEHKRNYLDKLTLSSYLKSQKLFIKGTSNGGATKVKIEGNSHYFLNFDYSIIESVEM